MSIASEISRLTGLRDTIKNKLVSLGLLQISGGGGEQHRGGGVVTGSGDLASCATALSSINETTPYMIQSTGAQNVAGYKYAQVDTTVFEPIGSSGNIDPNATVKYLGDSVSDRQPTNYSSIGQISPIGQYQGMSAVNLYIDTDTISSSNIKRGVRILGVDGNLDFSSWDTAHCGVFNPQSQHSSDLTDRIYINGPSIYFPLLKLDGQDTPMQNGDLSVGDIQHLTVISQNWEINSSDAYKVIGIEYIRDVYNGNGQDYKLIFTVLKDGKICRVYSSDASIGLYTRTTTDYGSVLNVRIQAGNSSSTWHQIDSHNRTQGNDATGHSFQGALSFDESFWYHIDVKYLR